MKKNILAACISLILFTAFVGCNNGFSGTKPPLGGTGNTAQFIPDDIDEKKFSDMSPSDKAEIQSLYGCYWPDGGKIQCAEIGDNKLVVYSIIMSSGYENIRWAKVSDMWVCCSYLKTDSDYDPKNRKVIFKFIKDGGNFVLRQYIVPMGTEEGPFKKGKDVEKIEEGGEDWYVYDNGHPKMKKPIVR